MKTGTPNPYAAPATLGTEEDLGTDKYISASQGARFLNLLIDTVFFSLIMAVLEVAVEMIYPRGVPITADLISYVLYFLYFLLMEAVCGRTVGKFITGTKVVDLAGNPASFGKILGRTACRFIPFEPFSFLGGNASGWHDTVPKTRVVKSRKVTGPS